MSRILIVDDEPPVLEVLASLLTDEGFTVRTAPDGRVALEMLADDLPDLLHHRCDEAAPRWLDVAGRRP